MKKLKFTLLLNLLGIALCAQVLDANFTPKVLQAGGGTALAVQADNKVLVIAHSRGFVDNQAMNFMFRLHENGTLDPSFQYPSQLSSGPQSIKLQQDGKILIGGNFINAAGQYVGGVMRLLPDGSIDPSFSIVKTENQTIDKIEVLPNQKIFVLSSQFRVNFAAPGLPFTYRALLLDKDGGLSPNYSEPTLNGQITSIGVQSNNELILSGSNIKIGNRTQGVFRMDSTGLLDPGFNPQIPSSVHGFLGQNMVIQPSGTLGFTGGTTIVLFNRNGEFLRSQTLFNAGARLFRAKGNVFVMVGLSVYEISETGEVKKSPSVNTNDAVIDLVEQQDGQLVILGNFTSIGNQFRAGLARLNRDGLNALVLDPNFKTGLYIPGIVRDLLIQKDGKLIVGGQFHRINEQNAFHIARLLPDGSLDRTFNTEMANLSRGVHKIRQQADGTLVVASERTSGPANGKLNGLDLTNPDGYQIRTLNFPFYDLSKALTYLDLGPGGKIYAGDNSVYSQNGRANQEFARFSPNGVLEANYNELYLDGVKRVEGFTNGKNDKLLLYGQGIRYDQSDTTCLLQLLPNGERDPNFQLNFDKSATALAALSLDTSTSMVGGRLRNNAGTGAFLLKLDTNGQIIQAPKLSRSDDNYADVSGLFELPGGRILVSGSFDRYNDIPVNNQIVIDQNARFVANFLPQMPTDQANYTSHANIDQNSMYVGGFFKAPNGAIGLLKVTNLLTSSSTVVNKVKKGKIFPNPSATETLYLELDSQIQSSSVQYQMLEMGSGKVLGSGRVVNPTLQSFDLKALKQGAYVLRLLGVDWEESHVFSKVK